MSTLQKGYIFWIHLLFSSVRNIGFKVCLVTAIYQRSLRIIYTHLNARRHSLYHGRILSHRTVHSRLILPESPRRINLLFTSLLRRAPSRIENIYIYIFSIARGNFISCKEIYTLKTPIPIDINTRIFHRSNVNRVLA